MIGTAPPSFALKSVTTKCRAGNPGTRMADIGKGPWRGYGSVISTVTSRGSFAPARKYSSRVRTGV